jgi:hypothetical protein
MNFLVVRSSSPMGPNECSLVVDIPISAPSPNWLPSEKREEALTMVTLELTLHVNSWALA